jgi:hypothetical protein
VKEAVAKATGLGVRAAFAEITVPGDDPMSAADGRGRDWRVALRRVGPHHVAAVAVRAAAGEAVAVRFARGLRCRANDSAARTKPTRVNRPRVR